MAGVKGRSGRRSVPDEQKRREALQESWDIILRDLRDPDVSREAKRDMALKLVIKSMPTELAGTIAHEVIAMGTITKEIKGVQNELEFNIGGEIEPPEDIERTGEATTAHHPV